MKREGGIHRAACLRLLLCGPIAFVLSTPLPVASVSLHREATACLHCHGNPALELSLTSGERRSLFVDRDRFERSIHGAKLICTDCHRDIHGYPHPKRTFQNIREFTLAYYESCKGCHFDNYARTLDSVHYTVFSEGNLQAPLCVDCHGAHDVRSAGTPRSGISRTCSRCHDGVYREYAESAHGKALLQEENAEVPVCTDCHQSHNIEDPRTVSFHLRSPALCASCHADPKRMKKVGLSVSDHRTYVGDFHGRAVPFAGANRSDPKIIAPVCTDCHGVHRIVSVDDPQRAAIRDNMMKTCRACHEGDVRTAPAAWFSHYEPTPARAPLVYGVLLFYKFFIPVMVAGFVVQILLHVWRVVVNR